MASAMTSCNNDNDDFVAQKAPVAPKQEQSSNNGSKPVETEFNGKLYFAVSDAQLAYLNNEYKVQVGNETMTVNVENLQTTTKYPAAVEEALKDLKVTPTFYVYTIPAGMKGQVTVTNNWSVKNVELPEKIDMFIGVSSNNDSCIRMLVGYQCDKLDKLIARQNSMSALTTTLK